MPRGAARPPSSADLGEVRGRLAAAKERQQRDPLNEFCGGMVGYVLGRKAGASVGEVVGRTVQVAVERADDPQASSRQGPDNEAPLGNNGAMSITNIISIKAWYTYLALSQYKYLCINTLYITIIIKDN